MSKTKIHTQYFDDMYQKLPSVTTVLGVINKPQLLKWAWDCGMKGVDYIKERDNKGDIGTLTHKLILAYLQGEKFDTREYSKDDIDKAETCFIKFLDWEKQHPFTVIEAEKSMVSNQYKYGGTFDLYCEMDGKPTLIDFKSGKGIYEPEMPAQLAAYAQLLRENDKLSAQWMIVRIGRDDKEGFEVRSYDNMELYWRVFESALDLYYAIQNAKGR